MLFCHFFEETLYGRVERSAGRFVEAEQIKETVTGEVKMRCVNLVDMY